MADHGIALFEEPRLLGNGRLTGRASATASRLSKASGEILQHDPGGDGNGYPRSAYSLIHHLAAQIVSFCFPVPAPVCVVAYRDWME